MRYRDGRRSVCVSSQSGCPLTCTFCATGAMKFGRNLTASEILDQALHFRRIEPVDHLVFMGMGEPMMNLDNVLAACAPAARRRHHAPPHRRSRRSAGSPGIERLTETDMPIRLALSLHAPEDALRSQIMPVNDRYPLAEVLEACEALLRAPAPPGLHRVRDARRRQRPLRAGASQLAELLDPRIYKVNLIPYNPTGSIYDGSVARARSPRSRPRSRSTACARRCASPAAATSTPPAGSWPAQALQADASRRRGPRARRAPRRRAAGGRAARASSSGLGSHCAGSGRSSSERRPNSFRNSGVVR